MLARGKRATFAAGEDCGPCGAAGRILVILSGTIRVYMASPRGAQFTLCYRGQGETAFCQEVTKPAFRLAALGTVHVLEFSSAHLARLIHQDEGLASAVARDAHRHQEVMTAGMEIAMFGTVRQRVIQHMLCMLDCESGKSGQLTVSVTQTGLADAAGTAREVVGRALRELQEERSVDVRRGKLHVRDLAGLHQELSEAFPDACRLLFPAPSGPPGPLEPRVDQRRWP